MTTVVFIFGILISIGGLAVSIKPKYITNVFENYGNSLGLHIFAIIVRTVFGIALLLAANVSRFPIVLQALGALLVLSAVVLAVIGRGRFKDLIKWALNIPSSTQRVMGFFGLVFGVFLIFSVYY